MQNLTSMTREEIIENIAETLNSKKSTFEDKGKCLREAYAEIKKRGYKKAREMKVPARIPDYDSFLWQVKNVWLKGRI